MLRESNRAPLLHKAMELSGPHKLLERVHHEAYSSGVRDGKRAMLPLVFLSAGVGAALALGVQRLSWYLADCRAELLDADNWKESHSNDLTRFDDQEQGPEPSAESEN